MSALDPSAPGLPLAGGGGGGGSIPVTDPADLLSGATASRVVATDGSGDGVLLTGAATRALTSTAVSYEPADVGDWTARQPAGGGTAAVTGGDLVLTQSPSVSTINDPGRCSLLRTLDPDIAEGEGFEIIFRLAAFVAEGTTLFHLHLGSLADGSGGRELRGRVTNTGGVGLGLLDKGGGWHDAGAAGTVALDGTGWLRLRVRDRDAEISTGAGASQPTSWTRRVRLAWDLEITSGGYGTASPPADWTRWGVALTQYGKPSGTVSVSVDHVSIRRFGS